MKRNNNWLFIVLLMALSVFLMSSGNAIAAIDGGYIGTTACLACHDATGGGVGASDKSSFLETGHPYKFRQTNGADCGAGACGPISNILPTPAVASIVTLTPRSPVDVAPADGLLDWSDIDGVIGGWGWKARFTMEEGYVWSGTAVQYNVLTDTWSGYHSGEDKSYNCSRCHNTNGTRDLTQTRAELDPLKYGSIHTYDGVQCESCHANSVRVENGANVSNGAAHQADYNVTMGVADGGGAAMCGRCHNRDSGDEPDYSGADTSGGYIRHHEQWDEMVGTGTGAHASLDCVTCHDPHKRSHDVPDGSGSSVIDVATALGITDNGTWPAPGINLVGFGGDAGKIICYQCHSTIANTTDNQTTTVDAITPGAHATVTCDDCHMAEATKSATASSGLTWGKKADVKSHIFRIDTSATGVDTASVNPARESLSLEYACGKCHDAGNLMGGATTALTKAQAATTALRYHQLTPVTVDGGYAGSDICNNCHKHKYEDWKRSGHPYKFRQTNEADCGNPAGTCDALSESLPTPAIADISTLTDRFPVDDGSGNLAWTDIDAVIGGWGWKARYTMVEGYVWSGTAVQYNVLAQSDLDPLDLRADWSGYHSGEDKSYNCSRCHNTNGTRDLAQSRQELDPLKYGSIHTFDGVHCEACHADSVRVENGANSSNAVAHITTGAAMGIAENGVDVDGSGVANTNDMCGRCHNRVSGDEPLTSTGAETSGGMIRHHEQYNELVGTGTGVHAALECTDCHDPHKRSHTMPPAQVAALNTDLPAWYQIDDNDQSAEARGAVVSCESCHTTTGLKNGLVGYHYGEGIVCIDCHMAEATKSATAESGVYAKNGDVKTHIFAIDPAGADTAVADPALEALSLNYVCGKCHDTGLSTYVGVSLSEAEAAMYAVGAHGPGTGSDTGTSTAAYARFNWYQGAACYQVNFDGSDNDSTCSWDFNGEGSSTDCVTSFTFSSAGTKLVTLTTAGGTRTMAVTAKAVNALPTTVMSVAVDGGDATGMTLEVTDGSSASGCAGVTIATSVVIWGDGTTTVAATSTGPFAHQYNVPGTYTISYSTRDSSGNKSFSAPQTWTVPDLATSVCDVEGDITGTSILIGTKVTVKEGATVVKLGQTDTLGHYSIPNVTAGHNYDVIPSRNGYEFTPASIGLTLDCGVNNTANDFTASSIW